MTVAERLKQEGRVEKAREAILEVLQLRFGQIPDPVDDNLHRLDQINHLDELHRQAVVAEDLAEFQVQLNALE